MVSLAKALRLGRILFRWQIQKASVLDYMPEEVSVEVTNVCNFKCAFCPQSQPDHHDHVPKSYLEPAAADVILRRLREGGIKTKTLHWTLDGEPFMNRRFGELCDAALRHGFSNMYFATNGMLLTEDIVASLPKHSGARYTFTIDFASDQAYFEDVRGSRGSWQKISYNISRILNDIDLPQFHIELSDISPYMHSDKAETERRFTELCNLIPDPHKRLKVFQKTFHNAAGLVEKHVATSSGRKYHLCPYPWTSLFVASNGDIVACCRDLRRQTVLGNILKESLAEIWNGAAFQELRNNLIDKKPELSAACKGCDLPYDDAKFSMENVVRTAKRRLQLAN